MLYNWECCSFYPNNFGASALMLKKGLTAEDILKVHPIFARISNTVIINLTYLAAVENNTQRCRLCPPFEHIVISASRRYFGKLKERFELL